MRRRRGFPAIIRPCSAIAASSASRSRSRSIPAAAHCCTIRRPMTASRSSCARPINDARGEISELLGKAINRGALDRGTDRARQGADARVPAALRRPVARPRLRGLDARGLQDLAGAARDQAGVRRDPVPLSVLLDADMWSGMLFEESFTQQATMFQPVGGMDRIAAAFAQEARPGRAPARARSPPSGAHDSGASIAYRRQADGQARCDRRRLLHRHHPAQGPAADRMRFSPAYRAAMTDVDYGNAVKIAWQSRRFWEIDDAHLRRDFLDGRPDRRWCGIRATACSRQRESCSAPMRVACGCRRCWRQAAARAVRADAARRSKACIPAAAASSKADGDRLEQGAVQPRHRRALAARPGERDYALLNEPDGPFYFAGEHLSQLGAWQGGRGSVGAAGDRT